MPKMNYKGATVQFQRVKVKKAPKIEEVEMTEEERHELEKKALEEQKIKESLAEKKPQWNLYYDLKGDSEIMTRDYWTKLIDEQFENVAGDADDRWQILRSEFQVQETLDQFEEFDGQN